MKTTFYKNTFLQTTACALIILGNVAFAPVPQMTLEDIPGPSPSAEQALPQAVPHQPIINESAQPIVEDISPVVPSNNPTVSTTTIIAPLAKQPVQAATAAPVPQKPGATARPHPVVTTEEAAPAAPAVATPAAKEAVAVPAPQPVVLEQPKTAQKPVVVEHRATPATRVGEAMPSATATAEATKPTAEEAAKAVSNKKMLMFNAMAVLALVFLAFFNYFLWRSTRKQQGVTEEQLADARKALEEVNRVAMAGEKVEKPAKQKAAARASAKIGKEDAA